MWKEMMVLTQACFQVAVVSAVKGQLTPEIDVGRVEGEATRVVEKGKRKIKNRTEA